MFLRSTAVAGFTLLGALSMSSTATLYPLSSVRLLPSPFSKAVEANRQYILALDADRLLAAFRREAGLKPKKESYGNWENIGLDGHTAGHYLSALADMIGAGSDTPDHELDKRLDYMLSELDECQKASGDGYLGGVPGSKAFWKDISAGHIEAFNQKWVPWYNVHKTFAGLRDAYEVANKPKAKLLLVKLADWACNVIAPLSDDQMQRMLGFEHGGMNEVLADVYAITGNNKYIEAAKRFNHLAILAPLERKEDRLTGLHANTQIPKVVGFARIASLNHEDLMENAAKFFWDDVTSKRSVAFGGNSVSEHFNDPKDFHGLLEHREGPETCNTYNMLRLSEALFSAEPNAKYVDYYERALYNHILASINPTHPGYVYFTPIRPAHYRVYSQPGLGFWCCVGTGMENPGRYGQLIYAAAKEGVYVNLFIPSELHDSRYGLTLRQETTFPDSEQSKLTLKLKKSAEFSLLIRHPKWVREGVFQVKVNGKPVPSQTSPSSYLSIRRSWKDGDKVEIKTPMGISVEGLPDGSNWYSVLHGPIVLVNPTGTKDQDGLLARDGRGDHIANGPLVSLDKAPALLATPEQLAANVQASSGGFVIKGIEASPSTSSISLVPFYKLQESRYQMYWELTTKEGIAERKARQAAEEREKLLRDQRTVDFVAVGEQQPEVDHNLQGDGLETGIFNGRRWRHGKRIEYTLNSKEQTSLLLSVTYSGNDSGRAFTITVNGQEIAKVELVGGQPGRFLEKTYPIPDEVLKQAKDGKLKVSFQATTWLAGGLYDVRLLRP